MTPPYTFAKTRDGRQLEVLDYGGDDIPIIYLHGTPCGAVQFTWMVDACKDAGLRLIAYNREGYGKSSRRQGRKVVDIVTDVEDVLAHLKIDESVLVMGWSGGGPHALACAARLPNCLGALILATTAPWNADGLDYYKGMGEDNITETKAALAGEEECRKHCEKERAEIMKAGPKELSEMMSSILPKSDLAVWDDVIGRELTNGFHKALEESADGYIDDDLAFVSDWGFKFDEVKIPVSLWHGSEDLMCPFDHGKWVSKQLPEESTKTHLLEGEGHISVVIGQFRKALAEIKELADLPIN